MITYELLANSQSYNTEESEKMYTTFLRYKDLKYKLYPNLLLFPVSIHLFASAIILSEYCSENNINRWNVRKDFISQISMLFCLFIPHDHHCNICSRWTICSNKKEHSDNKPGNWKHILHSISYIVTTERLILLLNFLMANVYIMDY